MDRDYTVYEKWKEHLGPLGFKKARLQAGWAKTEQEKKERIKSGFLAECDAAISTFRRASFWTRGLGERLRQA